VVHEYYVEGDICSGVKNKSNVDGVIVKNGGECLPLERQNEFGELFDIPPSIRKTGERNILKTSVTNLLIKNIPKEKNISINFGHLRFTKILLTNLHIGIFSYVANFTYSVFSILAELNQIPDNCLDIFFNYLMVYIFVQLRMSI
jgi:hypothetical protein